MENELIEFIQVRAWFNKSCKPGETFPSVTHVTLGETIIPFESIAYQMDENRLTIQASVKRCVTMSQYKGGISQDWYELNPRKIHFDTLSEQEVSNIRFTWYDGKDDAKLIDKVIVRLVGDKKSLKECIIDPAIAPKKVTLDIIPHSMRHGIKMFVDNYDADHKPYHKQRKY